MPDADVLALFEQEAGERVAALGELLLRLRADTDVVASLFREAHTLKGTAVVVGLDHVAEAAHALEEILADVRTGDRPITAELVDVLFAALDALAASAGLATPGRPPSSPTSPTADEAGEVSQPAPRRDTARVDVQRLDELVRLAGEATAAQQRVTELLRGALPGDPCGVPEVQALVRVLGDLHEATLRARMLPIGTLSTALGLIARDAARKTGKVVRCEVRGEHTELDRHVHELLADALLHLVRNAVDHGIEDPATRRAAGKLDEGTILVHAVPLGSRAIVTVSDDGAGVDVAAVRRRAAELGIDADRFDDGEVLQLLFRPGFSTVGTVTDVSGRGVGLDAVREGMALVRGRVEVASVPGEGTRFRISVPITLTVVRGLLVTAGGRRFALPAGNVVAVADPLAVLAHGGAPHVLHGDRAVPVASLLDLLAVPGAPPTGPVVVLAGLDRTAAVRVDAVGEERAVLVKPLPPDVPASELVVGAGVEPDGTPLWVLDGESLVDAATTTRGHQPPDPLASAAQEIPS